LNAVKSGKGGYAQGNYNILEISPIFGGTTPENVTQDANTGSNNIQKAKVALMFFPYVEGSYTRN
jgi:hypothetical protein